MPILREQEGSGRPNFNQAIGPFYLPESVMRRLNIDTDTLGEMARKGRLIALPTAEGQMVYPVKQFSTNEDGRVTVNPAVEVAFNFLLESDVVDLALIVDDNEFGLLWTIAGVLLQPDERGEILLHSLRNNLDNPQHESWQKLNDLNGIISKIRSVLPSEGLSES